MSKTYNGHRNWTHWNVSLWINNDEGLYRMARDCARRASTRREAASNFVSMLNDAGIVKTPDGARYSMTAVYHAMEGM